MIEATILRHISALVKVPVYMEIPESPPDQYVILEKTGSSRSNHIEMATFAIQSYAQSMYDAAVLNDAVKAAADDLISLNAISRVSLNSDYNYTYTNTKQYRYQAVYDITYYE